MRAAAIRLVMIGVAGLLLAGLAPHAVQVAEGRAGVAPAAVQTVVLQRGLNGYNGVADTWISPSENTLNYGQNGTLILNRNGRDNPLLRFALSGIPNTSAVLSATLTLYNTSPSSLGGGDEFARRIELFQVLTDWDEGNQIASPIDASGKHGATGDRAFDYFTGEGADVAWDAPGMTAGVDYAAAPEGYADVVDEGFYSWDVTALVRAWVRNEQPNYGLVLRDATGYEDDHNDMRVFVSSQDPQTPGRRPKLTVVFNPDVPFADAGPDQEDLAWDESAVLLTGAASHDRPGGDDASLTYTWRIITPAFGSALSGQLATGPTPTHNFTPDVAGEWEIELEVINNAGERATDRMHLRLLKIPAGHPRIFLTPAKLQTLKNRAVAGNPRWTQLEAEAASSDGGMHVKALVYQITGNAEYCDAAIAAAFDLIDTPGEYATKAGDLALVYDWCYARLDAGERTDFNTYFDGWSAGPKTEDSPGWGNYWPRHGYSYALVGLATLGDNPSAQAWLDEYRHRRYQDNDLPLLERIAAGGAWPEGMVYDWIANWPRVMAVDAWRDATGENLFASTDWYQERLGYLLLHRWPGTADQFGFKYHPYVSTGDADRNRGSLTNYERIMALILIERFPNDPLARQLQALLTAPPFDNSMRFLYHAEFLWFNPDQPTTPPSQLSHFAAGTGTLFLRSGWPSGATDDDTRATYITFQSGDHFTYHQHFDQNSFTLFKGGDLLIDSGVYSGEGLSNHDINYYVRTIAHNTLVVYNPDEDFNDARPDATSNDGGQRTVYPGSRSPQTIEDFDKFAVHYETGDILRFEDTPAYSYVLGDATAAYNNPTYNQAMDTDLSGNTAKVTRFQREFLYLRPQPTGDSTPSGEYVLLFDRVGVTEPAYSGENTKLLFHMLNEPTVNGAATAVSSGETLFTNASLATVTSGEGSLTLQVLLPPAHNLRKVGGRGAKSFWAFDANYDWHWALDEAQPRPINDFESEPYGEWRLELEPADTALNHNFLTLLHPALTGAANGPVALPATTLITTTGMAGAFIADPRLGHVTLFSAAANGSPPTGTIAYSYTPVTDTLHTIFDLTPGARYALVVETTGGVQTVTLAPLASGALQVNAQGVLSFTLEPDGETPPPPALLFLPLMRDE